MVLDRLCLLKVFRLGGVILLLVLIIGRFYSGESTKLNYLLPSWFVQFCLQIKEKINISLSRVLREPQLSLMKGLFFGGKNNLPKELKNKIRKVGLSHLIAVSGFHFNIITQFLSFILDLLSITGIFNFIINIIFIFGFTIMADFSASVIRAAIMSILLLIARLTHRLYNSGFALIFTVLIMVFLNPQILVEDLGFQLSVLSTLGIIYLYPVLEKATFWQKEIFKKQLAFLKEIILLNISASLLVMPWIIYKTQYFSLVAPLTNILIVPLVPFAMILGFVIILLNFLFFPLALFVGFCLDFLLIYIIQVINIFSQWRLAEILFPPLNIYWIIIYYFLLIYYIYQANKKIVIREIS